MGQKIKYWDKYLLNYKKLKHVLAAIGRYNWLVQKKVGED